MAEIETQKLKALTDLNRKQRIVMGWLGIGIGTLACLLPWGRS